MAIHHARPASAPRTHPPKAHPKGPKGGQAFARLVRGRAVSDSGRGAEGAIAPASEPLSAPSARPRPGSDPDEPAGLAPLRKRKGERRERAPEDGAFEPFRATPVLQPLVESAPPVAGSGLERAQAAAMAERLLHSVRVGKVAGGHEVRLTLAGSRVEVRLREVDGQLVPELHLPEGATGADAAAADSLAVRLDAELRTRGVDFDVIAIVG